MPLFLFRSAMVLRLWLALVAFLASFFLRSWVVSRLCPWPRGLPVTAAEFSGRYLKEQHPPHDEGHELEEALMGRPPQSPLGATTEVTPWPRSGREMEPQPWA